MAHTYTNLQPSLSAILKEVVQSTSDAISGEIGYTVKYRHNGFKALMNELAEASQVNSTRNDRYPLIALIQPFRFETNGTASGIDVKPDILILMDTDPHKTSDERELESYDAILRPTHAEFISQLKKHPLVYFKGVQPQSSGMDIYHLGDERGGKVGYELPDYLDAILIEGLDLHIHAEQSCLQISVPCSPQHEVLLYEAFTNVSFTNTGEAIIIGILAVDYVNFGTDVGATFTLTDGRGTTFSIDELTPKLMDVSNHSDGVYIGRITSSRGASMEFEYRVRTAECYSIAHALITTEFQDLDCAYAFDYPLSITTDGDSTGIVTLSSMSINTEDGTVIHSDTFAPSTTSFTDSHITTITALLNSYYVNVVTSNGNTITNKIIINLKNI